MKVLHGKQTMTIAELREALNKYHQDMPVFASWEGVMASIKEENFATEEYGSENCLVIDVEDYNT